MPNCTLCKSESSWYCPVLNSNICDGCCMYDMKELDAIQYIKLRTGKKLTWTYITDICFCCQRNRTTFN